MRSLMVSVSMLVCVGCAQNYTQYTHHDGAVVRLDFGRAVFAPEPNDLARQSVVMIHHEIVRRCLADLAIANPDADRVIVVDDPAQLYRDDKNLKEAFRRAELGSASELSRFCQRWIENLKGFDPPDNPHTTRHYYDGSGGGSSYSSISERRARFIDQAYQ